MSYTEFSVTYIHNKFWGVNSIKVPSRQVVLDDNWHTTEHLFKTENQKYYFEIFWEEYMVGGEVCLPGEWNYACVNGKFFHLEKTRSQGFIDDQETFYYTLLYDDWQNDWLTNNVHLLGTINLTGDKELVKQHIVQTTPLLNNVNNFRYLNGKRTEGHGISVIIPEDESPWIKSPRLSSFDYVAINKELERLRLGEPNREKLIIPFLYRTTPKYDWKWLIIKAIKRLEQKTVGIYDVDQANELRRTLEVKFNTNELYTISTKENKAFNYAKTLVDTKYIEEIDLSGFTDLVPLSSTTLSPEYGSSSIPKFNLKGLCEKLRSRFNWDKALIPKMEELMTDVFAKELGDLINRDVESNPKTVFKNVTLAPIKRDVNWMNHETSIMEKNPEWLTKLDSLIPFQKFYRNFIFSRDDLKNNQLVMIVGTSSKTSSTTRFAEWLSKQGDEGWSSWLSTYLGRTGSNVNFNPILVKRQGISGDDLSDALESDIKAFDVINLCRTKGVQLVIPIHQYKLVEEGNEDSSELDFTRTDWFNDTVLMLMPDYERKTHVLSIRCPLGEEQGRDRFDLFFDFRDNDNPLKGKPIYPYVTTELFEISDTSVTDARWRKNLHNEWTKTVKNYWYIDPSTVARHFVYSNYVIKYKTYYSRCAQKKFCDYNQYISHSMEAVNGYQSGTFRMWLIRPIDKSKSVTQYQMEFTLPYSERLINILKAYNNISDRAFAWKVINGTESKGLDNHPDPYPLIWKEGAVRRMDKTDESKLGTKDVIAVWLSPVNFGGWASTNDSSELLGDWDSYNKLDDIKKAPAVILANTLIDWLTNNSYWPHPDTTPYYLIPLRIKNDARQDELVSGVYQVSTGFVRPYDGFDYLCYYRFMPLHGRHQLDGFGFSDTTTPYSFTGTDYFVMVIPNKWSNSQAPVPKYSYREKLTNMSRESNIAFLVNGAYSLFGDNKEDAQWGGWRFSNNHSSEGWKKADEINDRMAAMVNQADIFFEEFVKKEFKSNRTCNPSVLKNEYRYYYNGWQTFNITTLDDEIPPFMVKYLDPDNELCQTLHNWKTSSASNDNDRLKELKDKLITTLTNLKVLLSTQNQWFSLEGTDWYASVKLNIQEQVTWDFELFTTKPSLFKSRTTDTWTFENYKEDDIDVLINTSNEITIYGKRIAQKSRYISETDELDIRLKVTPLEDVKQTVTSTWYKVEMKTDDQDLIRDILEIPKEQVKGVQLSVYEREELFRKIELRAAERSSEAQLLEISRDRFKQKDYFEQLENARTGTHRIAMAAADIAFGTAKAAVAWTGRDSFLATASSIEQAVKGGINLADAMWETGNVETDRKARFALGVREFDVKGARMQQQHLTNQANDMARLSQMSSRIQYPQMNSGLIYKQYNASEGLSDVYITQYYPSGKLLKYIKEYYKEYGYEILVRDFFCLGVSSIKRHLRYTNIFKNEYPNQRIRALIEARALNGIMVTDNEIFW